jgi:hypothetical protein
MRDERKWKLGLVQFQALRANIPTLVSEKVVQEYHAVLDLLAVASEEDLNAFRVPQEELKPRVTGAQIGSHRHPGRTFYSKDNFCESNFFKRKIDSLSRYLPAVEQSFQTQVIPPAAAGYYELSDDELEQLAIKYKIEEYGQSYGKAISRNAIIKQLLARDRAIREANPIPHQTITVGTMIDSAIQQGSPGATATITVNSGALKAIIEKLNEEIPRLGLGGADEKEVRSDIATMELQLDSGRPKSVIIKESLISVRGILEKIAGSLGAAGVLHLIEQYFKHHP